MQYLKLDEVLRIHERAVVQYGGSLGVRDLGLLESAIATPQQTMFGDDLYPDLVSKSAALIYSLIKNHPFIDGNKRAGLVCFLRFLEINGLVLDVADDDLYQFTLDVATKINKDQIAEWIRARVREK